MRERKPDRVVLDTNVVVSAIISGRFFEIISFPVEQGIHLYTCEKQIKELQSTLSKRRIRKLISASPKKYCEIYGLAAIEVEIDERFDRSPDPDDNYLFDLAYSVKSFYLVTNEKALLNMKRVNEIKIISMVAFKKIIKGR